jgi:hypothetical protein
MMKPRFFKRYWKTLLAVAVLVPVLVAEPEWSFPAAPAFGTGLPAMAEWHHQPNWNAVLMRAIKSTPVRLCMFDSDGCVIRSNQHFTAMYGLRPGGPNTCRDSLEKHLALFSPKRRLEYIHDFDGGKPAFDPLQKCSALRASAVNLRIGP